MAPSATNISPQEGTNGAFEIASNGGEEIINQAENTFPSPRTKLYTDAYTHGYTEGYIKGNELPRNMPIAIVGMACRLPGNVSTPDEFWELCSRARSGWSEIPKERFEAASFYHPNQGKSGCFNAIGGNFLKEDVAKFDAPFFNLTGVHSLFHPKVPACAALSRIFIADTLGSPRSNFDGSPAAYSIRVHI